MNCQGAWVQLYFGLNVRLKTMFLISTLSIVAEPMESMSEEMDPRELNKMCHSEISCSTSTNFQKEVAVRPTITEFRNKVTDIVNTSSETVRKDPKPIQNERPAAPAPKPGKICNETTNTRIVGFPFS